MDRIIEKRKWPPKKIITYTLTATLLLLVVYLLFFRDKGSRMYVQRNTVTLSEAREELFQEFIPIDGVVFTKTTSYIDALMGGNVHEEYVEDGAMLNKGDKIVKLVNTNLELSYMEQETRIFEAINNLQNSKIALEQNKFTRQKEIVALRQLIEQTTASFDREKMLFADSLISVQEFEEFERAYRFTKKQLDISLELQKLDSVSAVRRYDQIDVSMDRLLHNLDLLRESLGNLVVKAPAEGKLSSFSLEIGQTASAGEHLGQIDIPNDFKLKANIDERYISRVYTGQEAEFEFNGKVYPLYVHKIYTDVTSGSFQVDLYFTGDYPDYIKRGQTLQLRLKFSGQTNAITIRRGGFFQQTGGNWIFVVDPSGAFAVKRPIRINRQNTLSYEVVEGLSAGEQVITSSYELFANKDKLILKD